MATLFERVTKYAEKKKRQPLSQDQRMELGRIVIEKYSAIKEKTVPVHKVTYTNETGTYRVICYPKTFVPTIDLLIKEYYSKLPAPKERKRIPIGNSKPFYSTRNFK